MCDPVKVALLKTLATYNQPIHASYDFPTGLYFPTSTSLGIVNNAVLTAVFNLGLSLGYPDNAPLGGLITKGAIGVGTNVPSSNVLSTFTTSNNYSVGMLLNGSTNYVGSNLLGLQITENYIPYSGSYSTYGIVNTPTTNLQNNCAGVNGLYSRININVTSGYTGTSNYAFGILVDPIVMTAGTTINHAYGSYIKNPGSGSPGTITTAQAMYSDDLSIGYAGVNIPANSIAVSGCVCIGTYAQSGSSLLTLGTAGTGSSGITFNNNISGYVPSDLHCYEEYYVVSTTYTCGGSTLGPANITLTRIGNTVHCAVSSLYGQTISGSGNWYNNTAIPQRFRPNNSVNFIVFTQDNGTNTIGIANVNTSGIITWNTSPNGGTFNGANNGINAQTFTWTI
jgi:hypothetical protein